MEVKESAACGIAEREFTIEVSETEIVKFYKYLDEVSKQVKNDMIEDLLADMEHVVGQALNEEG